MLSACISRLSATTSALFSTASAAGLLLQAARVIRPSAATTKAIFFIRMLAIINNVSHQARAVAKVPQIAPFTPQSIAKYFNRHFLDQDPTYERKRVILG